MIPADWVLGRPRDTHVWLAFLIAACLLCASQVAWMLGVGDVGDAYASCGTIAADGSGTPESADARQAYRACISGPNRTIAVGVLRTVGTFLAIAIGFYQVQALWRMARYRHRKLDPATAGPLASLVARLAHRVGLPVTPELYLGRGGAMASVYGQQSKPRIAVGATLINAVNHPDTAGDAVYVVSHELAHIRNGDVRLYYFATAVFRALFAVTVAVVVAVGSLVALGYPVPPVFDPVAAAVYGLVLLAAYLSLKALLRSREHLADLRTVAWSNRPERITQALERFGHHASTSSRGPQAPGVPRLLAHHPSVPRRLMIIKTPELLTRLGLGRALLVGTVAGLIGEWTTLVLRLGFTDSSVGRWASTLGGILTGCYIGAALAVAVWRQVELDHLDGVYGHRLWTLAVGGVAGVALGRNVTRLSESLPTDAIGSLVVLCAAAAVVLIAMLAWIRWCATLRVDAGQRYFSYRIGILGGAMVGPWIFAAFAEIVEYLNQPSTQTVATTTGAATIAVAKPPAITAAQDALGGPIGVLTVLTVLALIGTPAAAVLSRRRTAARAAASQSRPATAAITPASAPNETGTTGTTAPSHLAPLPAPSVVATPDAPRVPVTKQVSPTSLLLPGWLAALFITACSAAVILTHTGRPDGLVLSGTTTLLAILAAISTRARITAFVAAAATAGSAAWFTHVALSTPADDRALRRALLAAVIGMALNLTIDTRIDWRLSGLASLALGWIGWLALLLGFLGAQIGDAIPFARKRSATARRQWSGLVLAGATACVIATSALPLWESLEQLLPAAWRD